MSDAMVVLAGGFGTRLRSEVPDVPKPLAPVGGRPFLTDLLGQWVTQGVSRFVFALHHQADLMREYVARELARGVLAGCEATCVDEAVPLGTGGAVANAIRGGGVDGPFLVSNADTWLGGGIAQLRPAASPAMAVVRVPDCGRYGSLDIEHGRVSRFLEKDATRGAGWINAGLYRLDARDFQDWNGEAFSLERDRFPGWAAQGRLTAVPVTSTFIDIGVPEDYRRYQRWADSGHVGAP